MEQQEFHSDIWDLLEYEIILESMISLLDHSFLLVPMFLMHSLSQPYILWVSEMNVSQSPS